MANQKITDLPAGGVARLDDQFEIVQDVATSPVSNTVSTEELPFHNPDIPPAVAGSQDDEFPGTSLGGAWTITNQNGYAVNVSRSHLSISHATGQSGYIAVHRALPTAPYTVTMKICLSLVSINFQNIGVCLHKAGTQQAKTITWDTSAGPALRISYWTAYGSISAGGVTQLGLMAPSFYLRFRDNNTNVFYEFSNDGINFITLFSEARTTNFTADRFGLFMFNNTGPAAMSCDWARSSP